MRITSPSDGATFPAGSDITLEAEAEDDGQIIRVSFYNGNTRLTRDYAAPYNYVWEDVPAGTYTITAVATDNDSAHIRSAPITIVVEDGNPGDNCHVNAAPDASQWVVRKSWADNNLGAGTSNADSALRITQRA